MHISLSKISFLGIIMTAMMFFASVAHAQVFQDPTGTFPNNNTNPPVHTGDFFQRKGTGAVVVPGNLNQSVIGNLLFPNNGAGLLETGDLVSRRAIFGAQVVASPKFCLTPNGTFPSFINVLPQYNSNPSNCITSWPTAGATLPPGFGNDTLRHDGANWTRNGRFLTNNQGKAYLMGSDASSSEVTMASGNTSNVPWNTNEYVPDFFVKGTGYFSNLVGFPKGINIGGAVTSNLMNGFINPDPVAFPNTTGTPETHITGRLRFNLASNDAMYGQYAAAPGKVLMSLDDIGTATWQTLPSAANPLPPAQNHETMRFNSATNSWVANNTLLADGAGKVRIGNGWNGSVSGDAELSVMNKTALGGDTFSSMWQNTTTSIGVDSGDFDQSNTNPGNPNMLTKFVVNGSSWLGGSVIMTGNSQVGVPVPGFTKNFIVTGNNDVRGSIVNGPADSALQSPCTAATGPCGGAGEVVINDPTYVSNDLSVAGNIRITGGSPQAGRVLKATNNNGMTVWDKVTEVSSSAITYVNQVGVPAGVPINTGVVKAQCPSGYQVISGGVSCPLTGDTILGGGILEGVSVVNRPSSTHTAWEGYCKGTPISPVPIGVPIFPTALHPYVAHPGDLRATTVVDAVCLKVN